MSTFKTTQSVRLKVAEGEASFFIPGSTTEMDNSEFGGRWLKIPKGSEFTVCAKFEKTDTFLVAATMTLDGVKLINGIALRRMSFNKLMKSSKSVKAEKAEKPEKAEIIESKEAAA